MTVRDIQDEIQRHEEAIKALREKLKSIVDSHMKTVLDSVAEKQDIKVVSEKPRMVLVKASSLIGNPWNINFHDWKSAADFLVKWFEGKKLAPEKWYNTLKDLYDKRKEPNRVDLVMKDYNFFGYATTRKEPISAEFVKLVLDEFEK